MYNNAQKQEIYKIYVSDVLRIISENTAKISGGSYIKKRYIDMVETNNKQVKTKKSDRPARDIIDDVVKNTGIKVVKR